ncbi:LptA/OstA family protein [Acidobacteriota bacterium]
MSVSSRTWIRRLSTSALVLLLVALAATVSQRFRKFRTPLTEVDSGEVVSGGGDRAIGVYTGFEYVERVAGKLIFELMSKRTLGLSSGWHEIEGVKLQFYRDGAPGPVLISDGASFNIQTRDARLEGGVRIEMPSGAVLTTDAGRFEASSRRFTANSDVYFYSGASFGRARNAAYDLERDEVILSEGVVLTAEDGTTLTAPSAVYQRSKQTILFRDGGKVQLGDSEVKAPSMAVVLEEDDGPPNRIELAGGVEARIAGLSEGGSVKAWMERAVAERDARGRWQIDATTSGPWVTVRFTGGEGYFERTLRTWILRAVIADNGILNLRAERGVCIHEIPAEGPPRMGEAQEARVWFSEGQATDIELLQDVVIRAGDLEGRGYRARLSPQAGLTMLHGDPTGPERVLLLSDRGRVSCDQAQIFNEDGRAEARGNVQGSIADVSIMGNGDGTSDPAHFASEILEVSGEGVVYHLRENTRFWQGHRLLLADDVVYRNDITTVRAAGHVRTTLPASQLELEGSPEEDVVVVARSLDYEQATGTAIYRGNVRYSDPKHTLSAAELTVFFDDDNEVTAVEAVGAVELVELETGRRMTGQRARRDVALQTVTISGSPVRLTDEAGNVVSGSSLTWNQADGTVSVAGGTETIYYPEELP